MGVGWHPRSHLLCIGSPLWVWPYTCGHRESINTGDQANFTLVGKGSHTTEEKWPYPQERKPAWVLELQRGEEGDPMQRRCDLGCQPTGRMRETHIRRVAQSSVIGSRWGDEDLSQRRESSKWFWTWIEKNLVGKCEDPCLVSFCFLAWGCTPPRCAVGVSVLCVLPNSLHARAETGSWGLV